MYQMSMFNNAFKSQRYLGSGLYARVHAIGEGWVVKHCSTKDGTLNYLEWCQRMQAAGEGMDGMPEIDFLVHTAEGYIVTMRQYKPQADDCCTDFKELEYMQELVAAFEAYMADTFHEYSFAHDLHGGNAMLDARGNFILTDPSAYGYCTLPHVDSFALSPTWEH